MLFRSRRDGIRNEDFSILKRTPITERIVLIFRAEAFNILNRVNFGPPNTDFTDRTTFGIVGVQANTPRQLQVAARIEW